MQIWGSVKNAKISRFLDIFWDILGKRKINLGHECVKRGLLSFQGKIRTNSPDLPGKMRVSGFNPTFPPVPL